MKALKAAAVCTCVIATGSIRAAVNLARVSGSDMIWNTALLSSATVVAGMVAGAKRWFQPVATNGSPCSLKVGTAGENGERPAPDVARMRSLPASCCGNRESSVLLGVQVRRGVDGDK